MVHVFFREHVIVAQGYCRGTLIAAFEIPLDPTFLSDCRDDVAALTARCMDAILAFVRANPSTVELRLPDSSEQKKRFTDEEKKQLMKAKEAIEMENK